MALIVPGISPTVISGRLGGVVFNKGGTAGPTVRRLAFPRNRRTVPQENIKANFGALASLWGTLLTPAQRAAWRTYSDGTPLPNRLGSPINVGGLQMFLRTNILRRLASQTDILAAPVTLGQAPAPSLEEVDNAFWLLGSSDRPNQLVVTGGGFLDVVDSPAAFLLFFGGPLPTADGVAAPPRHFIFVGALPGNVANDDGGALQAPFQIGILQTFYRLRMRQIDAEGRVSPTSEEWIDTSAFTSATVISANSTEASTTITLIMSATLATETLNVAEWTYTEGGSPLGLASITTSGTAVTITTSGPTSDDDSTLIYTGDDPKFRTGTQGFVIGFTQLVTFP